MSTLFDVEKVLQRVQTLQPEESRLVFAEEIFDWTDNYTETLLATPDTPEAQHASDSICNLWIQYATMEQNLRQWKKAVQVYDDALNDPVASRFVKIYLAYADLCKLRGKVSNAQKVYIKGLTTSNFSQSETDKIWRDFLLTMRENGSPELSADQLYAAVSSQVGYQSMNKPSSNLLDEVVSKPPPPIETISDEPLPKKIKTEIKVEPIPTTTTVTATATPATATTTTTANIATAAPAVATTPHFLSPSQRLTDLLEKIPQGSNFEPAGSTPESHDKSTPRLSLNNIHEISSIQTVEDLLNFHSSRPTMLFRPINPENIKQFALFSDINKDLVGDIEQFFSMKISVLCEIDRDIPDSKVSRVLDIIEALWISQGLNERYFDYWFSNLIQFQVKEESILKARFLEEEKQVISGSGTTGQSTTLDILRSKQKIEFRNFRIKCELQIQTLNSYVNCVMEKILQEQLAVLSLIDDFPHKVVDKSEGVGGGRAAAGGDGEQQENFALFKQIVNALLSIRVHSRSRPSTLKRSQSIDSLTGSSTENQSENNDYEGAAESMSPLEAARAAAAATRKTTFKKKRRRNVPYQQSFYTSHFGGSMLDSKEQYSDSHIHIPHSHPHSLSHSLPPMDHHEGFTSYQPNPPIVSSNLHKLAALLGKAKK